MGAKTQFPGARSSIYLSALLFVIALAGCIAVVRLRSGMGDFRLVAAALVGFAALGAAAAALVLPRLVGWAKSRGWRVPGASPITVQGGVFVALVLLVAGAALYSGNNLLYLVLSGMLAATLMSGLVSRLDLAGLQLTLGLPDHIFAGRACLVRLGLTNLKALIPSFALRVHAETHDGAFSMQGVYFPMVAARDGVRASAEAIFARRGRYGGASVHLATRFPFGLVERRVKLELKERVVVYPSVVETDEVRRIIGSLRRAAASRMSGDSHDLYRVRPALASDGARFIHWKASAGSPELWVREFTREARFSVRLVLDRRVAEAGTEGFERAISTCAAVAWKLAGIGADVVLATDERSIVCRAGERIYELLGYLALVEPVPPDGPQAPVGGERDTEFVFRADEGVATEPVA